MRLKPTALLMIALTIGLAGCNDALDSVVDPSTVKNKVEYQLPSRIRGITPGAHSVQIVSSDHALQTQSRNAYYVDGC